VTHSTPRWSKAFAAVKTSSSTSPVWPKPWTGDWHSPKQWNLGKLAFDSKYLPLYAEHCARLVGALRGKSRDA